MAVGHGTDVTGPCFAALSKATASYETRNQKELLHLPASLPSPWVNLAERAAVTRTRFETLE